MRRSCLAFLLLLLTAPLAADFRLLYDFEGDTDNFTGQTKSVPTGATQGKSALEINAKGSVGWNQNLAVLAKNDDWSDGVELLMDVTVPEGTNKAVEYVQIVPTFAGPLDNFYQSGKIKLKDGLNKVAININGKGKIGTPYKFHLVVLNGKAMPGPIYVDNIRMRIPDKPGTLILDVKNTAGQPLEGAIVGVGTEAVLTNAAGRAEVRMPGDKYTTEVIKDGYASLSFTAVIDAGKSRTQLVTLTQLLRPAPRMVSAQVNAEKPGIAFDAHKMYGHNMVMWNTADPFTNPLSLKKLRNAGATMMRIPGGGYSNQWNWETGNVHKQDQAAALDWTPEATWDVWKKFFNVLGPREEAFMTLNIFQRSPADMVAWVRSARDAGIKVRYVELGNEPDLDPHIFFHTGVGDSTEVAKYVKVAAEHARAIRAAFPDIKILGPCTSQITNKECPHTSPWLCDQTTNEEWIQKFLRLYSKEGDLLDGIAFHSYPYWPGDPPTWDPVKAFESTLLMEKYMPKWRGWLKEYYPKKWDQMDLAMTEYHMQVPESFATADLAAAVWHANYLAEFIKYGGTMAHAWDINTMKMGDGGGHGMLDINNDPTRPYAERAKYWTFKMLARNFTGSFLPSQTSDPHVAVYAAKDRNRTTVMVINRDATVPATVSIQVSGVNPAVRQLRTLRLSSKEYVWSRALYRAVVNTDPTLGVNQKITAAPVESQGWRSFSPTVEPMSLNLYVLEP